jgi:hypothetical protein
MKLFTHSIHWFLLFGCFLSLYAEPLIHRSRSRYGPNIGHALAFEAPMGSQAHVISQAYRFRFAWIEPLGEGSYYQPVDDQDAFFSLRWDAEASAYYGQIKSELGLQVLPFLEFSLAFRHLHYFGSNVEMGTPNLTTRTVQETWRGAYIYKNAFNQIEMDYIHSFDFTQRLSFNYNQWFLEALGMLSYVDVNNHFAGKNYDYHYAMPVFERDYFMALIVDIAVPLQPSHYDIYLEGEFYRQGWFNGDESKQPLSEIRVRGGSMIHLQGREMRHTLVLDAGYIFRNVGFVEQATWRDRVLLRATWQYNRLFGLGLLKTLQED